MFSMLLLSSCNSDKHLSTDSSNSADNSAESSLDSSSDVDVESDKELSSGEGSEVSKQPAGTDKPSASKAPTASNDKVETVKVGPNIPKINYPNPPNNNFEYKNLANTMTGDMKFLAAKSENFTVSPAKTVDVFGSKTRIFNALDFGVTPNDLTDDSAALNSAIQQMRALSSQATLYIPAGLYIINQPLKFYGGMRVIGDFKSIENRNGTIFLAYYGHGNEDLDPLISVDGTSAIKGIEIYYPKQSKANPVKYPPTIKGGGDRITLEDMFIVNAWYAIDLNIASGQHHVRNVYGQPLKTGIIIDYAKDVGRLDNVNFHAYWSIHAAEFTRKNLTGIQFLTTDWQYVEEVHISNANVGLEFKMFSSGKPNVIINRSEIKNSNYSVKILDCQTHAGVTFSETTFDGQFYVEYSNTGPIRVENCTFKSNSYQNNLLNLHGAGTIIIRNSKIDSSRNKELSVPVIRLNVDKAIITNNSFIGSHKTHILIDTETKSAVLKGNTVKDGKLVVDKKGTGQYSY